MVNLLTVKRVLTMDLRMDSQAIDSCLQSAAVSGPDVSDSTLIPLSEALRIVALAETMAASVR